MHSLETIIRLNDREADRELKERRLAKGERNGSEQHERARTSDARSNGKLRNHRGEQSAGSLQDKLHGELQQHDARAVNGASVHKRGRS